MYTNKSMKSASEIYLITIKNTNIALSVLILLVRQPNPVFLHNLALESTVVFNVELAFQGH